LILLELEDVANDLNACKTKGGGMSNTFWGINAQLLSEVESGLVALRKDGYTAEARTTARGVSIQFRFGENTQTLHFTREQMCEPGAVSAAIVERLDI
jgi:hypothetical protein